MLCKLNCQFLVVIPLVFFVCAAESNPIIIRSGIAKNRAQQQNDDVFDLAHHKGIANYEGAEGFNRDNENKYVKAQDSAKYDEEGGKENKHVDQKNFADEKFFQNGGGHVSDFGNKVAHKKGHHKSGFHNSYHKDETGSNSSYYDDGDNEGDEYVYDTKKGSYGDKGQHRQQGGHLDSTNYAQDHAKHGQYDNSNNFQKDQGNQQNYNKKNYYNNREDEARRNAGNRFGEEGRFGEEKYIERPHYLPGNQYYHDDHYYDRPEYDRPLAQIAPIQKKRITIYEDPRVFDRGGLDYQRYEYEPQYSNNDYVEIEVKRPLGADDYRYHERRSPPAYDYYYY